MSVHGGNGHAVARALGLDPAEILDLSASVNPMASDPTPVLARHLDGLAHYPDPWPATAALAEAMGIDVERVLLTNGGAEAIALVAADVVRGWAEECDFALYRRHLPVLHADGAHFRSNPHNPTGRLAAPDDRADVWDEAFYPLATGQWTRGDEGSVVVGSLTKLLACPGLRIGYVLADPATIERLRHRQPQWAVNGLACAALPELLDALDLAATARAVARLRAQLVDVLDAAGLHPLASDANFVLCDNVYGELAKRGVVVRDGTSFGLPDHVRIAVPDERGLARLAEALS